MMYGPPNLFEGWAVLLLTKRGYFDRIDACLFCCLYAGNERLFGYAKERLCHFFKNYLDRTKNN